MNDNDLKYKIGVTLIPGIGNINGKVLIAHIGSVEGIFKEKQSNLEKIPGIGKILAKEIYNQNILSRAEEEIEFINKYNINCLFYLDQDYPNRLKNCDDSPIMIYLKGDCNLNSTKILSIVGTRNATSNGKQICNDIVSNLINNHPELIIVSGLAYGIDICAHKAALANNANTAAILGHGLDIIYPAVHKPIAQNIIKQGALISEFLSKGAIDKMNFVKRNRIIAGLSDATIVIESALKGGSLITADIANSYNRDVFAIPGRIEDTYSQGCNFLIKTSRAALIEKASDIEYFLGWESSKNKKVIQKELFITLTEKEKTIIELLKSGEASVDSISNSMKLPISVLSASLLNLEFSGLIKCMPGKIYSIKM